MHVAQGEDFGDGVALGDGADAHADGHDDQADAKDGIQFADDFVNGQEGGDEEVDEDDGQPEVLVGQDASAAAIAAAQVSQQAGRADGEHNAHHEQQHGGEHTHNLLHDVAHVHTGQLRNAEALVTHGHEAGSEVMNTAGENGTEGDPQEHAGAPHCAAHSTPDGAQACNVQQLDQENTPAGHDDVVNAVLHGDCRRFAVIRTEGLGYKSAIDEVSSDQDCQTYEETNHKLPSLQYGATGLRSSGAHFQTQNRSVGAPLPHRDIVLRFSVKVNKNI